MKNDINFIGPVGPASSGKGHLVDALIAKGYEKVSLSDAIRDDLEELYPGRKHLRKDYQDIGDQKRREFGNDYWAKRAGKRVSELISEGKTKFAIDSLRNPAEVLWFKKNLGMITIAVDAPLELRLKWAINRARSIDPTADIDKLRRDFERDMGHNQPEYGQQVEECIALADNKIYNDGTLRQLDEKINNTLLSIGVEGNQNNRKKK